MDGTRHGRRLPPWRDLWLPLVLGLLDLAAVLLTGPSDGPARAYQAAALLILPAALWWRRIAPWPVLLITLVMLTIGAFVLPADVGYVLLSADLIALYSLTVHRTRRAAVQGFLAAMASQLVIVPATSTTVGIAFAAMVLAALGYGVVLALGRSQRRWRAARTAVTDRLATADAERRFAAATERGRLARELHDVTAHQLSSVVVYATGALRLAASRPETLREALELAVTGGREAIEALQRLVKVIDDTDAGPSADGVTLDRVDDLVAAFLRLGQPVRLDVVGRPVPLPVEIDTAGHRIVQESLTNALRYATGGLVRVRIEYGAEELILTVDDAGRDGDPAAVSGAGLGVQGMHERARTVGGRLTAGPLPGGGWSVRAALPIGGSRRPVTGLAPRWYRAASTRTLDALLAGLVGVMPLLVALVNEGVPEAPRVFAGPLSVTALVVLLTAQSAAMLWRRQAPGWAWTGTTATHCLWVLAVCVGVMSPDSVWLMEVTFVGQLIAVYSLGRFGRRWWHGLALVPATAAILPGAVLITQSVAGSFAERPAEASGLLVASGVSGVLSLLAWGAGRWLWRRYRRTLVREEALLATVAAATAEAVRAERARLADGLQASVLGHADRLVGAAQDGLDALSAGHRDGARQRLEAVCEEGRAALVTMRGLLGSLHDDAEPGEQQPQPTADGLGALCAQYRRAGRTVTLTIDGRPQALPAGVDLSVYRVVEVVLAESGTAEVHVTVTYGPGAVRLAVDGPADGRPDVNALAAVSERVDAVGGLASVRSTVEGWCLLAWFPLPEPARAGAGRTGGP